jgi:flagella basal body P-ring formation protein FlgA
MARLNVGQLARDVTHDDKKIIGFEASRPIRVGETFSKAKLIVPPIISAGQRVTISYRAGLLEATASGIALDTVGEGETVKVKNESSNKIITGIALEAGLVGVKP